MKITNIVWKKALDVIELYQYQHLQKVSKLQVLSKDKCNEVIEIDSFQTEEPTGVNIEDLTKVYSRPSIFKSIYDSSS